jgi:SAM-dependent methyltransferase
LGSGDHHAHEHDGVLPEGASADASRSERERIDAVYGAYQSSGRSQQRWDPSARGNRCILAERRAAVGALLARVPEGARILEVGCGAGGVLSELRAAGPPGVRLTGVDLLPDRLVEATTSGAGPVLRADGTALPFGTSSFDVVAVFTMFSSVLDQAVRRQIAEEIRRVLRPDGSVLWYDMRWPSPSNRSVRPLTRKGVGRLFPGGSVEVTSLTLAPPLARRLGQRDERLYPVLRRVPFLRSHLIGAIRCGSYDTQIATVCDDVS